MKTLKPKETAILKDTREFYKILRPLTHGLYWTDLMKSSGKQGKIVNNTYRII